MRHAWTHGCSAGVGWVFGGVGWRGVLGATSPVVLCDSDRLNFFKRTQDILDVPGLRVEHVGSDGPGIEPDPPLSHRVVVSVIPDTMERAESDPDALCGGVVVVLVW